MIRGTKVTINDNQGISMAEAINQAMCSNARVTITTIDGKNYNGFVTDQHPKHKGSAYLVGIGPSKGVEIPINPSMVSSISY